MIEFYRLLYPLLDKPTKQRLALATAGMVVLAFLQLYLARELGLHALLPWEAKGRPVTPRQVRRIMPTLLVQLGTPARACQPRGKAPGRAKGFRPQPAQRYPVIHKTSKKQKKGKKVRVT